MGRYLFTAKFTLIEEGIGGYIIEFPELPELESIETIYGRELDDAKEHLWSYIYNLIKKDKHISEVTKEVNIVLKENEFIKHIKVDTEVIQEVYEGNKPLLSQTPCIASCEGMCRRVLKEIKKQYEGSSIDALRELYRQDKLHGGNDYKNIIKLGQFMKLVSEDQLNHEDELKKIMNESVQKNIVALRELAKK